MSLLPQSQSFQKRGSVKAEKSLSAVELSGKVVKRGYLLKQVSTPISRVCIANYLCVRMLTCVSVCQGHKVKNWKVRLFVLRAEPGFLHYYDPSKVRVSIKYSQIHTCVSDQVLKCVVSCAVYFCADLYISCDGHPL